MGDNWSVAWRVYDAQHWGVPQRRRRIYLIASFASECAGEILFERKSLPGDIEPSIEAWQAFTHHAGSGIDGSHIIIHKERAGKPGGVRASCVMKQDDALPCQHTQTSTLPTNGEPPACFMGGQGAKARSIAFTVDGSPTLKSVPSGGNTIPDVVYCVEGHVIDRQSGQNGAGYKEDSAYTLNTIDRHGVCYSVDCRNNVLNEELSATIQAKGGSLNALNPVMYDSDKENDAEDDL